MFKVVEIAQGATFVCAVLGLPKDAWNVMSVCYCILYKEHNPVHPSTLARLVNLFNAEG